MDVRARLIFLGSMTALSGVCFCWTKRSQEERIEAIVEATREKPGAAPEVLAPPPKTPESLARDEESHLRSLSGTDPRLAVKEARLLLGADAGLMVAMVQRVLPDLLLEDVRRSLGDKRYQDAEATVAELAELGGSKALEQARKLLENASGDRLWDAVAVGDFAAAEAMLEKELLRRGNTRFELSRDVPRRIAEKHLKAWDEAGRPQSGPTLDELELAAALTVGREHDNPVVEALSKPGARSLADRCRALEASERRAAAVLCWSAARGELKPASHTASPEARVFEARSVQLDDARARATLRLLDEVASKGSKWIPPRTALSAGDRLFNHARDRGDLARRKKEPDAEWKAFERELVQTRIRLWVAEARRQLAHETPDAALATIGLLYSHEAGWLFDHRVADGWDAWAAAPEDLKRGLDARLAAPTRHARLRSAVEQAKWIPDFPELLSAQTVAGKARIQWGLAQLDAGDKARRELGEELLRGVLRESTQVSDAQAIIAAVQERLRKVGEASDFSRLLELASFYAAEVALANARDPFRDELKGLLVRAAEHFRQSGGLERLFLLTLIADLFPADQEGRAAREEALATFFDALDRARADPYPDTSKLPPSGLAGLNVAALENATGYHLLLFFDGPERFFVRVSPRRRGSVVFKDGKYRHGAVVTDAKITPARGEPQYQSRFIEGRYRIVRERAGQVTEDLDKYSVPLGNYPLLRAPEGEQLEVDLDSGRVTRKK